MPITERGRKSIFKDSLKTICPPLLTALLFVIVTNSVFLPSLEKALMERKKEMIHELTESVWHILQNFAAKADRGEIAHETARREAISQIRQIRYGDDGKNYFWINDMHPAMVMHPYRTDLEGKDLSGFIDPRGKALFNKFVEVARNNEEGFVDYMWQWKDDPARVVPKISFVKSFQPWGWIVGTGIYLDDVQREIGVISRKVMFFCGLIFATVLLLGLFMVNHGLHVAGQRRKAEEELALHYANLENLVQERTGCLEEANQHLQREIQERSEIETAYRESEKKYRTLYQTANDAIVLLDGYRFASCNPKTLEIFRCPESDFIDRDFFYYSPDAQPDGTPSAVRLREKAEQALAGNPQFFEWRFRICDAAHIDAEISLNRVELSGSTCLQAIIRDITRRKFMEQQVQHARNIDSLGVLAGGIAHDFNNLLTAIAGNISIARLKSKDIPVIDELLTRTENACKRAGDLSRQLLTFAKGGGPVKEVTRIADLIPDVCNFALCGAKTCCRYDLAPDLYPVQIDRGQISRLLQNLIINAVQAMPAGGEIWVIARNTVSAGETSDLKNGPYVRISVRDNGPGIAPEHLGKIFDPYFTTKQGGNGLGLAIAYSIAKKHEGTLTVESDTGSGAVFHLSLPASSRPGQATARPHVGDARPNGTFHGEEEKILLMDDEAIVREVAAEIMKVLGYEPGLARDGREAIDMYRNALRAGSPYAAVILDLTVPGGMGGREAMAELLRIDPEIKAVVSSGYADDDVMANYEQYGFRAVIPKPYTVANFADVCKKVLRGS